MNVCLTFCVPLSPLMLQADTTLRLMEASTPLASEFSALMKSTSILLLFHATLPCLVLLCPVRHVSTFQSTYKVRIDALWGRQLQRRPAKTSCAAAILRVALRRNKSLRPTTGGRDTFNLKIHLPHQPKLQIGAAAAAAAVRITQSQTQLCHKEKFNLWHVVRELLTWRNSRCSQNIILLPVIVTDRVVTIPSKIYLNLSPKIIHYIKGYSMIYIHIYKRFEAIPVSLKGLQQKLHLWLYYNKQLLNRIFPTAIWNNMLLGFF